jgi:hypothetical protein
MQNPASPPKFLRTCPTCNRPVEPGYKFCETCGTQMPELSTCSKCGTQFVTPVKNCELCGAPIIPGEVPEADDSPEYPPEEMTVAVEDQVQVPDEEKMPEPVPDTLPEDTEENVVPEPADSPECAEEEESRPVKDHITERDEEEIPEPDMNALPGENEKNPVPAGNKSPRHYAREIQEPDTDALLEQFGAEYDENETLASSREPKPGTAGDALYFSQGKRYPPAKPRVNRTRSIGVIMVLAAILAAVFFLGLPMLTGSGGFGAFSNQTAAGITPVPTSIATIPPTPVKTLGPAYGALVPLPTQLIPTGQKLYFQVQKNPVTSKISVIFAGSAGSGSISSADIRVTHPDGSITTGTILPLKGVTDITLDGSKETDRVEIIAKMSSGETYRVYDNLVSFMT